MKITIVGAGKVGGQLGRKLFAVGHDLVQVFSRSMEKAETLAKELGADFTNDLNRITAGADLYLLAVPDDAIRDVATYFAHHKFQEKLVAHTSGATPITVLTGQDIERCGVFYPLQSFSLGKEPDFSQIPFCIDAKRPDDLVLLKNLGAQLSPKVFEINDHQRAVLHIAAVFANNFSNHLYHIAFQLLEKEGLSFDLLLPLIRETVEKLETAAPAAMQTGPAVRGDEETIERHLRYLKSYPIYQEIYQRLTESIQAPEHQVT
ncbi:MAG: DUF2520 domain-containing protein [Saprospiraceae bacterium]|nr:DUF2520 domain-containing protein [Saprospiraceae bacterium]